LKTRTIYSLLLIFFLTSSRLLIGQSLPSPEDAFGFRMGSDRQLIDWNQIVDYFHALDRHSDRIIVQELGKTTLGKPFLMAVMSSEKNLRNLDHYQSIQKRIANPDDRTIEESQELLEEARAVVMVSLNIHATEIGSSQESVELAWELATRTDPKTRKILDNVIVLLMPSLNPDGLQMVVEWYREHVGTPHEGCSMPWLYHHYAGHDNNRDLFFFNLQESRLVSRILYRDWFPEIVYDQHQMGSTGARLFVPPYVDPVNLNVHPILMAEINMLGKHVVSDMQDQGFKGVETGSRFNAFFQGVMARTPIWHNILGILSEAASVRIATPIYLPRGSLEQHGPERPRYSHRTDFLDPWEGGWWRLRDIIEYEKAATYSILHLAATYRKKFVTNFFTMNMDAIKKGKDEPPYAYILPPEQQDPNSATEMLKRLDFNGIAIFRSQDDLKYAGVTYPRGTFVIPLSQPCRPAINDLLEPQVYPNMKQYPDGPPTPPYDFTGWTLPLQMGVEIVEMKTPIDVALTPADSYVFEPAGEIDAAAAAYIIERRYNNAYAIVNEWMKNKKTDVYWTDVNLHHDRETYPAGSLIVPNRGDAASVLEKLSAMYHVPVKGISQLPPVRGTRASRPRLGIYQPWITSMDEGWTRLVLDNFRFEHTSLHNEDIQSGKLAKNYDVIILPDMNTEGIVEGKRRWGGEPYLGVPEMPEKYQGGIDKKGVEALLEFVKNGGTIIAIGNACDFAIDKLKVPAVNVLKEVKPKDYYAPGSLLRIELDNTHPLAYGMPKHAAIRVANSPALRLLPYNREIHAVGYYTDDDPLLSGWLIGSEKLEGHTVLAEIPVEKGRVVLFGFGVQCRAQTYGTFKLLFNAILSSRIEPVESLKDTIE